jgi:hypothetical protein
MLLNERRKRVCADCDQGQVRRARPATASAGRLRGKAAVQPVNEWGLVENKQPSAAAHLAQVLCGLLVDQQGTQASGVAKDLFVCVWGGLTERARGSSRQEHKNKAHCVLDIKCNPRQLHLPLLKLLARSTGNNPKGTQTATQCARC